MEGNNFFFKNLILKTPDFQTNKEKINLREHLQTNTANKNIKISEFLTNIRFRKKKNFSFAEQHYCSKSRPNEENTIFSAENARDDMMSASLIKNIKINKTLKRNNCSNLRVRNNTNSSNLDPSINSQVLNSILNESYLVDSKKSKNEVFSVERKNVFNLQTNNVLKREINKSLIQKIIMKKMLEKPHIKQDPTKFMQNFKISRNNFNKKFIDFNSLREKIKEKSYSYEKKPIIQSDSKSFSFTELESKAQTIENIKNTIAEKKNSNKDSRYQIYLLNAKIKSLLSEKEEVEAKIEKKINEIQENQLLAITHSNEVNQKSATNVEKFMKCSVLQEEKRTKVLQTMEKISQFKNKVDFLKRSILEKEAEIKKSRNSKELLFYEIKELSKSFFSEIRSYKEYQTIFKIFIKINYLNFQEILPEFLEQEDIEFFIEYAKESLEREKLVKLKTKSFHNYNKSSNNFLKTIEKKCNFVRNSFHFQKNMADFKTDESNLFDENNNSSYKNNMLKSQNLKDIDTKITEKDKKLQELQKLHENLMKKKIKSTNSQFKKDFLNKKYQFFLEIQQLHE